MKSVVHGIILDSDIIRSIDIMTIPYAYIGLSTRPIVYARISTITMLKELMKSFVKTNTNFEKLTVKKDHNKFPSNPSAF